MKKYKTKLNREQAEALAFWLEPIVLDQNKDVATRIHQALLMNVFRDLKQKLSDPFRKEVAINWPPAEALAVHLFCLRVIDGSLMATYMGRTMMRISGEIDQLYA